LPRRRYSTLVASMEALRAAGTSRSFAASIAVEDEEEKGPVVVEKEHTKGREGQERRVGQSRAAAN
jgi:hypothetical protein